MIKNIDELDNDAQFLRVAWRKAHNYHTTLAKRFLEVKARVDAGEFGNDWNMSKWLMFKAGLSEEQLVKMILVYGKVLASEDRTKLEAADAQARYERQAQRKAELERQIAERAETQRLRAIAAQQKAAKKAERQQKAAEKKVATDERAARRRLAHAAELKRQSRIRVRERQQQAALAEGRDVLSSLAAEIKAGKAEAEQGREAWIRGTMRQAVALAEARVKFGNDNNAFSDWLIQNHIFYSKDDRAALINIGMNAEIALNILQNTTRDSFEKVWRHEIKPEVEANSVRHVSNTEILH